MRRTPVTRVAFLFLCTALFALAARADKVVATVPAGTQPGNGSTFGGLQSIAVNIATNKVYVANYGSANVTVIDGSNNQTTTIPVGANPVGVAVNPVTNRVYVTNATDGNVTAINGASDTVIGTIPAGTSPWAVAVNPVTNKVYVLNSGSANITVIDAAADANTATTVPSTGTTPTSVAINPVTNKIYIANQFGPLSNHLTVLNGADNTTTGVATGGSLAQVVVDPATNMVYLGDDGAGRIMVLNGADNTFASYVIVAPTALALNPVTNRIYAGSYNGTGYVLDGSVIYNTTTNPPPTVTLGTSPIAAAVNPVTNKSYIVNQDGTVSVIDGETSLVHSVTVGSNPNAVAVNPVTNKIYVANTGAGTVSVIDGVTDATGYAAALTGGPYHVCLPITAGTTPNDIAVNPMSNKAYVANQGSDNVTVIDGSTTVPIGATLYLTAPTATVPAGSQPTGVAVDPFRNVAYVANKGDGTMTTIDALNNATSLFTGTGPGAVAVNPVTNMVYVANTVENTVSIIDGATGLQAVKLVVGTQPAGGGPKGIAIDTNTNKTFVANYGSNDVTIIDGNNHYAKATVAVGTQPIAVAVNPQTGKAYVANYGSNNATVIDTANLNATTTVVAGTLPMAVTVDPSANKAYVGSQFGPYHVAIIDGANAVQAANATNMITAIAANPAFHRVASTSAGGPAIFNVLDTESATNGTVRGIGNIQVAIATDPVTGKIYQASSALDPTPAVPSNVVAVDQAPPPTIADPLTIAITEFANNTTQNATPSFTFTVSSAFAPTATVPNQVYYQLDGIDSLLRANNSGGGTFTGMSPALTPGPHVVYAFATDGQEASGGSAFVGALAKYMFLVLPAGAAPDAPAIGIAVSTDPNQATVSFSPPASDGGSPVVSYTATSSPDGIVATGTMSPITVQGLTSGTAYTFTVVARNAIGTSVPSAASNSVTPASPDPNPGSAPAAPAGVTATATAATSVSIGWTPSTGASNYVVLRSSSILNGFVILGTAVAPPVVDGGVSANTTYVYEVLATNSHGSSPYSAVDIATTVTFTDAALTNVFASVVHVDELRTAINAMLAAACLPAATFTDPTLVAGTTPIKAVHITELRSALDQARAAIGVPALVYTDPTITPGDTILKAAHLEELRAGTQ